MSKKEISTRNAPSPVGPYSQGIVANGFLYTAGFGPQDPNTGAMADGVEEQTRQVLRNIRSVLEAHGASMDDVVKSTVHLQHLDRDFAAFNGAYREFFAAPYPVRTTVGSTLAGILVEIDVVVALRP
ncbi:MAG: reactive intermediate/imine deaminase [Subtercola sp.]|nr:reactive intermediate/imine deaminase [Subtercola sp.]